jgi:Galactose oxidase, central domain
MALQLNPTVTDPFPSFQLYQLRRQVFDAMGFIYSAPGGITDELPILFTNNSFAQMGPLPQTDGNAQSNTPNSLVYEIKQRLGLPNPVAVSPDVLGNLLIQLSNFLGLGAMIKSLPTNVIPLLTNFINQAEQDLWRDIELDSGGNAIGATLTNPPARMSTAVVTNTTGTFTIAAVGSTQVVPVTTAAGMVLGQYMSVTDGTNNITGTITNIGGLNITVKTTVINTGSSGIVMATNALVIVGSISNLDATAIMQRAIALAKDHYGQDDSALYMEQSKKYISDFARRSPPNITSIIQLCLIDAQRLILRRIEMATTYFSGSPAYTDTGVVVLSGGSNRNITVAQFLDPADATSIDKEPVMLLALANVKAILKHEDGKLAMQAYENYMDDIEKRLPHDAVPFVSNALRRAQDTLYRQYKVFRMQRWYTWTTVAQQNFYGVYSDDGSSAPSPSGVTATIGSSGYGTMLEPLNSQAAMLITVGVNAGNAYLFLGYDPNWYYADLYTPSTGINTAGPQPLYPTLGYFGNTSAKVMLTNGQILAAGGLKGVNTTALSQLYDPIQNAWVNVGSMTDHRSAAFGVALLTGDALIVGGNYGSGVGDASSEVYSSSSQTFPGATYAPFSTLVDCGGAVLLPNGNVLAIGATYGSTAEVYNVATATWSVTGPMTASRKAFVASGHGPAMILNSGSLAMVIGGYDNSGNALASTQVYAYGSGTFSLGPNMTVARQLFTATKLQDGRILIVGGKDATASSTLASAEVYNTSTNTFTAVGNLVTGRSLHSAVVLSDGRVLISGGIDGTGTTLNTQEIFSPVTNTFSALGSPGGVQAYRVAYFNGSGYTLPSLPDTVISAVPAGSLVVITWPPSTNLSVTGASVYGRTLAANTTTTSTFVLQAVGGASASVPLTSAAGILIGATPTISDGTNVAQVKITNVVSNTITFTTQLIVSGAAGDVVSVGATVQLSAELHLADIAVGTNTYTDYGTTTPSGAMPTSNTTGGGIPYSLDPRGVYAVYASSNGTNWRPLVEGIPPFVYNSTTYGPPQFYEIRQQIEIWPPPADNTWQIQIKGYFSPLPFLVDTDTNSIDPQAIYLKALMDTQLHYKRPDAAAATREELEVYIGHLVAGTHHTHRYLPGALGMPRDATRPVLVGYPF